MTERYTVRLLSSDGVYPASALRLDDFAVLVSEPFAWSAVHLPDVDDYPAGEISWLTPDEIRFFGALSLAEAHPRTKGRLWIYTRSFYHVLHFEGSDPEQLVEQSQRIAAAMLQKSGEDYLIEPDVNGHPTTILRDYSDAVRELLEKMDTTDPLLIRGLYKLQMAVELRRHPKFLEESMLAAVTSREAALELLRRKLATKSGKRSKTEDVFADIERAFPTGGSFVEVLKSDWEARCLMAHPVNDCWSPPVDAYECYEALTSLTYLYRYLLLDEVWVPTESD